MNPPRLRAAAFAVSCAATFAHAPPSATAGPCEGAAAVVSCALATSPDVRAARTALQQIEGKRLTAATWMPAAPVVSGTVGRRRAPDDLTGGAWTASLQQELEMGGKRWRRLAEVDGARAAQLRRVVVVEQEVAAAAWRAHLELVAAAAAHHIAAAAAETSGKLAASVAARAAEGLAAGVDADLARAEATRMRVIAAGASGRLARSRVALQALLATPALPGIPPVGAALAAPPVPEADVDSLVEEALRLRADLAAARAEREVAARKLERLRAERVPNPTLSAFIERDAIEGTLVGGGVSVPLYLPGGWSPNRRGAIAEAQAEAGQADLTIEAVARRVRREVMDAAADLAAAGQTRAAFEGGVTDAAQKHLGTLAEAIAARTMAPREALLAQRSFLELLEADVAARLAEARARVDLLRATGRLLASEGTR